MRLRVAASLDERYQRHGGQAGPVYRGTRRARNLAFADSHHLTFDVDGRVSLPETLLDHANIDKSMCLSGWAGSFRFGSRTFCRVSGQCPQHGARKAYHVALPVGKPARRGVRVSERRGMQPAASAHAPDFCPSYSSSFIGSCHRRRARQRRCLSGWDLRGRRIHAPCWKPRVAQFLPLTATRRRWPMPVLG